MTAGDVLRRAHMSDSSLIRSRAARVSIELDEIAALLETDNPQAAAIAAADLERARLLAVLRAERFPTPPPLATT